MQIDRKPRREGIFGLQRCLATLPSQGSESQAGGKYRRNLHFLFKSSHLPLSSLTLAQRTHFPFSNYHVSRLPSLTFLSPLHSLFDACFPLISLLPNEPLPSSRFRYIDSSAPTYPGTPTSFIALCTLYFHVFLFHHAVFHYIRSYLTPILASILLGLIIFTSFIKLYAVFCHVFFLIHTSVFHYFITYQTQILTVILLGMFILISLLLSLFSTLYLSAFLIYITRFSIILGFSNTNPFTSHPFVLPYTQCFNNVSAMNLKDRIC